MAFKFSCKPCTYTKISQKYSYSRHRGIDLVNKKGTAIYAVASGTVVASSYGAWDKSYGKMVAIRHSNGTYTNYAHLNKIRVKVGQKVSAGTRIGDMGTTGNSTGVHLHFEVHLGKKWNRVDPLPYINAAGKKSSSTGTSKGGYTVGKTYTLKSNMNVRTGAGTNYAKKKRSALTANARKNCTSSSSAVLKKGTKVTCKGIVTSGSYTWMHIPSGWICAKKGSKTYVS